MNCPCHIQVFNQGLKSYKDLPIRLAEFGSCHRNEPSGALHGLMRVRNFTQDDAHIFCTEEQIQEEVSTFIDLVFEVYKTFGFDEIIIKLSTRPEKRVGSEEIWDKAEEALTKALDNKNLKWELQPGEGAFYGPKIEFSLKDCLNRVWQCGTIQVDFSMPIRLDATFIDINSKDYDQSLFNDISYSEAMSNLHGIMENGEIIRGLDVLAYSYELVGLGWVYYPLKIKLLSPLLRLVYRYWAKYRLQITGRSDIEKLCTSQCEQ